MKAWEIIQVNALIVLIIIISIFVGVGIIVSLLPIPDQTPIGIMLTLISIIVTLGVAYSFYSIYRAAGDVNEIKRDFEKLREKYEALNQSVDTRIENLSSELRSECRETREQINLKSNELSYQTTHLHLIQELDKLNTEANGKFRDRKFLLAIKKELESIEFLLNNVEYIQDELVSSIGRKRANIANDIVQFYTNISKSKFAKISNKEFADTHDTIICKKQNIVLSLKWEIVLEEERNRYDFLFSIISSLLKQLQIGVFPLEIDKEDLAKLEFYHKKFIEGARSDIENGIVEWMKNYKTVEDNDTHSSFS